MMYDRAPRDTSQVAALLFRLGVLLAFVVIVSRLYVLQIVQADAYQEAADENSRRAEVIPTNRGVIYDAQTPPLILAQNRPTFEIALIPEQIPTDDLETDVDEEAVRLLEILEVLGIERDPEVAVRIAEMMFKRLGHQDYIATVEGAGIKLELLEVPVRGVEVYTPTITARGEVIVQDEDDVVTQDPETNEIIAQRTITTTVTVPNLEEPLPSEGVVALLKFLLDIRRGGSASTPEPILDLADIAQASEIEEESYRLEGVKVSEVAVREYPQQDLFSHLLGFMGPIPEEATQAYSLDEFPNRNEKIGLNGLEFSYQDDLRGRPGVQWVEVDISGSLNRDLEQRVEPVDGQNLYLNVDGRLQQDTQPALQSMMEQAEAPWGVAIAMNPQTGAVLSMVSLPSYDNNIFTEGLGEGYLAVQNNERRPLTNYAIGGLYPPGSTFKIVTSAAALAEGTIGAETTYVDAGPLYLPNRFAPDNPAAAQKFVSWNHQYGINHGPLNVVGALAYSNDIFFYLVGGGWPPENVNGVGNENIANWAEFMGYGVRTQIDLPGEVSGLVARNRWKRNRYAQSWTTGDTYNTSIGQGFTLSTPLQVLVSTAAIANGGTVYQPQVVHHLTDSRGNVTRDFAPNPLVRLQEHGLTDYEVEVVRQGMLAAVELDTGTAKTSRVEGVSVAGKTGTAEYCDAVELEPDVWDCRYVTLNDGREVLPTHAWYAAFAPYENPEIAVVAFLYDGGEGSATAIPVVKSILESYFYDVQPQAVVSSQ